MRYRWTTGLVIVLQLILFAECRKKNELAVSAPVEDSTAKTDSILTRVNEIVGHYIGETEYHQSSWQAPQNNPTQLDTIYPDTIIVYFISADTLVAIDSSKYNTMFFKYSSTNKYNYTYSLRFHSTVNNAIFKPESDSLIFEKSSGSTDHITFGSSTNTMFRGKKL